MLKKRILNFLFALFFVFLFTSFVSSYSYNPEITSLELGIFNDKLRFYIGTAGLESPTYIIINGIIVGEFISPEIIENVLNLEGENELIVLSSDLVQEGGDIMPRYERIINAERTRSTTCFREGKLVGAKVSFTVSIDENSNLQIENFSSSEQITSPIIRISPPESKKGEYVYLESYILEKNVSYDIYFNNQKLKEVFSDENGKVEEVLELSSNLNVNSNFNLISLYKNGEKIISKPIVVKDQLIYDEREGGRADTYGWSIPSKPDLGDTIVLYGQGTPDYLGQFSPGEYYTIEPNKKYTVSLYAEDFGMFRDSFTVETDEYAKFNKTVKVKTSIISGIITGIASIFGITTSKEEIVNGGLHFTIKLAPREGRGLVQIGRKLEPC